MAELSLEEPGDLTGFPVAAVDEAGRVHQGDLGVWWFANDGKGRFDLPDPDGTCYLATDVYAAVREVTRGKPAARGWIAKRVITTVHVRDGAALADTTSADAGDFDVTKEICTTTDYGLCQRWAAALRNEGFAGLLHELRHDPRPVASGVSLFGRHGSRRGPGRVVGRRMLTEGDVTGAGVTAFDHPGSRNVTIVP